MACVQRLVSAATSPPTRSDSKRPLRFATSLLLAAIVAIAPGVRAEDVAVPVALQSELLVKVAAYDKNLPPRAGDRVRLLILTKPGNDDSARAASQMQSALAGKATIAGLPHEESQLAYGEAASLADAVKGRHIAIIYVTPGFSDGDIAAISHGLDGVDVLTASADPSFVPKGIVLGFDLVSGKPKLLVHLGQARRQRVDLSAEVLKLMKIYE